MRMCQHNEGSSPALSSDTYSMNGTSQHSYSYCSDSALCTQILGDIIIISKYVGHSIV